MFFKKKESEHIYSFDEFEKDYSDLNLKNDDNILLNCIKYVIDYGYTSTTMISKNFNIGYARAACLIDRLENLMIIGPSIGSKKRDVITTDYQKILLQLKKENEHKIQVQPHEYTPEIGSGLDFEFVCSEILIRNGFQTADVTKASNDYGVDIVATKDGVKYAIQCKWYSGSIGISAVQEVYTGKEYYNCHVGVVMTNSSFTKNAIELADKNRVLLWDGKIVNQMSKCDK